MFDPEKNFMVDPEKIHGLSRKNLAMVDPDKNYVDAEKN